MRRSFPARILCLLTLGSLAACAGDGPGAEEQTTWFDQIQAEVFDQSCIAGACHNSGTRAGDLSLEAGTSFDELVNVVPNNAAARANGLLRVLPESIEGSFLVAKLTGALMDGEGAQMPIGAPPIPDDQIANVEAWIAAGASPTAPPPDGGVPPTDPGNGPSFAEVQSVFDASCVSSACHNDGTRAGGLTLAAGSSYDALVGVAPANPNARDDGLLLVTPSEPDQSFLLNKLTGELAPGDGALMPLTGAALPDSDIALVREWIAAGAARN